MDDSDIDNSAAAKKVRRDKEAQKRVALQFSTVLRDLPARKKRTRIEDKAKGDAAHMVRMVAGLKDERFIGSLPIIPAKEKKDIPANKLAEHGFSYLRALALHFLDSEIVDNTRPLHPNPALMFDACIDVIGYAIFVQSSHWQSYPGIQVSLDALRDYLKTPHPEIVNYDAQAFLITLRAAREALPALATATVAWEPLLKDEKLFTIPRESSEDAILLRQINTYRTRFNKFFENGFRGLNEVIPQFIPLLVEGPDEIGKSYAELKKWYETGVDENDKVPQIVAVTAGEKSSAPVDVKLDQPSESYVPDLSRKIQRGDAPSLNYLPPLSPKIRDITTRAGDYKSEYLPAAIKAPYERHASAWRAAEGPWRQYANQKRANNSSMRWVQTEEDGSIIKPGHLTQKIISPFSATPEMKLIEEGESARPALIASISLGLSTAMQDDNRHDLAYLIAERLSYLMEMGEIPTEIFGHTTTSESRKKVIGRDRPMHYIIFKTFEESHNPKTLSRLSAILHTGMHRSGYPGEGTMEAYARLAHTPADRKILFVITDGRSSGAYLNRGGNPIKNLADRYFSDVVATIEERRKVEIVGISIKADVSEIFSLNVRIDSFEDIYRKLSPFALALLRKTDAGNVRAHRNLARAITAQQNGRILKPGVV